jgi:hypothetical protein
MKNFDIEEFEDLKNQWAEKKSQEFIEMVKSVLKNDEFLDEIADCIAWSRYNEKDYNKLFNAFDLGHDHVVCYLNEKYDCYKDEVLSGFLNYSNDVDVD